MAATLVLLLKEPGYRSSTFCIRTVKRVFTKRQHLGSVGQTRRFADDANLGETVERETKVLGAYYIKETIPLEGNTLLYGISQRVGGRWRVSAKPLANPLADDKVSLPFEVSQLSLAALPKSLWRNAQSFFKVYPQEPRYCQVLELLYHRSFKLRLFCNFYSRPGSRYLVKQMLATSALNVHKDADIIELKTSEFWSLSHYRDTNPVLDLSPHDLEHYVDEASDHNQSLGKAEKLLYTTVEEAIRNSRAGSLQRLLEGAAETGLEIMHEEFPSRRTAELNLYFKESQGRHEDPSGNRTVNVRLPGSHIGKPFVRSAGRSHRAIIAVGSNIGDRIKVIEKALQEMTRNGLKLKAISPLYETAPMYVTDQGPFLNGACEVETDLHPLELLDALQSIENNLGREKKLDKGPRNIDLDILLYDFASFSHERLDIPHKLMLERGFVLRPLTDIIPTERLPSPHNSLSLYAHLCNLEENTSSDQALAVTTLTPRMALMKPLYPSRSTQIMAILNLTPDSFSDGGIHSTTDLSTLESAVRGFIEAGATIIDIGGQSTRPKAGSVTADQEIERIMPAIRHIRSMQEANGIAISVDTFYAKVAEEAIGAGADMINDVTAGRSDSDMLETVAKLNKTIVLMHMRGTSHTMGKLTDYPDGVIEGVGSELLERVVAAKKAGVHPWRIILDPGIGFAKTQAQNLELLREFEKLRAYPGLAGLPWLIGTSRKAFIGKITNVKDAKQRTWGTAAAVTSSVRGGADIVRVHDVPEMVQVVKMADAIYRVKVDSAPVSVAKDIGEKLSQTEDEAPNEEDLWRVRTKGASPPTLPINNKNGALQERPADRPVIQSAPPPPEEHGPMTDHERAEQIEMLKAMLERARRE